MARKKDTPQKAALLGMAISGIICFLVPIIILGISQFLIHFLIQGTISRITDKILPIVKEWQERPLEEIYAVVFMDAIHYHVRMKAGL